MKSKFLFISNYLCLDFLNTEIIDKGIRVDLLAEFADLVAWLVEAGVLADDVGGDIAAKWNSRQAVASLERARTYRAALRRIVENVVGRKPPVQSDVDAINRILRKQKDYTYLYYKNNQFKAGSKPSFENDTHLLLPIAKSAVDLLVNANQSLIKKCSNPDCVLYYYDTSKNRKRRWCSMKMCGNRTKVAAHYERKKATDM